MSFSDLADSLPGLKTTEERSPVCDQIGDLVAADIKIIGDVMEKVKELAEMKKKPGGREGAAGICQAIATKSYVSAEPYLIAALPLILELCADKMKFVGELAQKVVKQIVEHINPYMSPTVVPMLMEQMGNEQKWQTHVAALQGLGYMMLAAGEVLSTLMYIIVPKVAAMMWEMKQEVKDAATQCLQDVCGCI
eukprot:COSAG06_NODE_16321_length_1007_cov_1.733480_1_plen_192_part_01